MRLPKADNSDLSNLTPDDSADYRRDQFWLMPTQICIRWHLCSIHWNPEWVSLIQGSFVYQVRIQETLPFHQRCHPVQISDGISQNWSCLCSALSSRVFWDCPEVPALGSLIQQMKALAKVQDPSFFYTFHPKARLYHTGKLYHRITDCIISTCSFWGGQSVPICMFHRFEDRQEHPVLTAIV